MVLTQTRKWTAPVLLLALCRFATDAEGGTNLSSRPIPPAERATAAAPRRHFNPGRLPIAPISSLLELAQSPTNGMARVQGVVLDQSLGQYVVIRDATGLVRAETRATTPLSGGETVTAWGTPYWDGRQVVLRRAWVRPESANFRFEAKVNPAPGKPATLPILRRVQQIRDLPPGEAAWNYPVRIHGVVTLVRKDFRAIFVQDATAGIFVSVAGVHSAADCSAGDEVEVAGVTDPGGYAPIVDASAVKVAGRGALPVARRVTLYQLATGLFDSQWVEVRGIMRSAHVNGSLSELEVSDPNGLVTVELPAAPSLTNLVDSLARIRGVGISRANAERQILHAYVASPSTNFITVDQPGGADPFALQAQPIASLSQFTASRTLQHRSKITGVVTFNEPGHPLFVQDASGGIAVRLTGAARLQPGDRVAVAGYLSLDSFGYLLRDAEFRKLGHPGLPAPKAVVSAAVPDPNLNDEWVELSARFVGFTHQANEDVLSLEEQGTILEAVRPDAEAGAALPPLGSVVRLRGVYSIVGDEARMPRAVRLLVPASQPVAVLEQPTWWTTTHALGVLGVVTLVGLAAALWAMTLRRRVGEQTLLIRERLEREASLQQRFRDIFEGANDVIFTHDLDGRLTSLNPAGRRLLGYDAAEVGGLTMERLIAPESLPVARRLCEAQAADGPAATCELVLLGQDGRRVLVEASTRVILKDGRPAGAQAIARDITERKRAEEALRESESHYRQLVELSPIAIFIESEGVFAFVNQAGLRLFGAVAPEELLGRPVMEVVHPDCRAVVNQRVERLRGAREAVPLIEEKYLRLDGTVVNVEVAASPILFANKPAAQVIVHDITDRKRAEAALAEASSLLRTLLDNSPDCIYFKDRQSRFIAYSKAFTKFFNVTNIGSLRGKSDFDFFTEEHARPAFEDEQEIIRTGQPLIGKLEKESHADGRVTWALTSKMPWRDNDGTIIGTVGTSKDITAFKIAEEQLAYERELFRVLIDNSPDAIYFKDLESRFVRVSRSKAEKTLPKARHFYRVAHPPQNGSDDWPAHLASVEAFAEYIIGKSDFDTYDEALARRAFEEEQTIVRTGTPLIGQLERLSEADGAARWMLVTKMPWRDAAGKIIGTFGVSRDITALKEAESKLESVHQRLIETSRLAGMAEVATDVLHNVGNVLNSVNVSCSLAVDLVRGSRASGLTKVCALLEENRERLGEFFAQDSRGRQIPEYLGALARHLASEHASLLTELEQLVKHVDHIKQIVAMQQNYAKVAGVVEKVSPTQLVDDALHINAAALSRHEVEVQREFDATPEILTEKHKVLQILVNLIRNAKYALDEARRPDKRLTVRIANEGADRVRIQVADNGVGIPPENLTRIFSHGFTTRRNGHGFGLHSSALAVRDLGGSLEAHSDGPGTGALFTLVLPHSPPAKSPRAL